MRRMDEVLGQEGLYGLGLVVDALEVELELLVLPHVLKRMLAQVDGGFFLVARYL